MLAMELEVGFGDAVRIGHVVVDGRSRQPVRAAAAGPTLHFKHSVLGHVDVVPPPRAISRARRAS